MHFCSNSSDETFSFYVNGFWPSRPRVLGFGLPHALTFTVGLVGRWRVGGEKSRRSVSFVFFMWEALNTLGFDLPHASTVIIESCGGWVGWLMGRENPDCLVGPFPIGNFAYFGHPFASFASCCYRIVGWMESRWGGSPDCLVCPFLWVVYASGSVLICQP